MGRRGRRGRWDRAAATVAALGSAALCATATVYAVEAVRGCDAPLVLDVADAPRLAPAVAAVAERFGRAGHEAGGRCVRAAVRAADPADVATLLSGRALPGPGTRRPDVWIPDSSLWPGRIPAGRRPAVGGPVAATPLVLVTVGASAPVTSWRPVLAADGRTRVRLPDPERAAAGMGVLVVARTLLGGSRDAGASFAALARTLRQGTLGDVRAGLTAAPGRPAVVVAPEQTVREHNRRSPAPAATAALPREGTVVLDHPFTVPRETEASPDRARAARLLERALRERSARAAFRREGFRDPGTASDALPVRALPVPADARIREIAQSWSRLALGSRMLSLIDVSGSMGAAVPGGGTRLQAVAEVSREGLALQPDDTELGQWLFATRLDGSRDWRETVPIGPLGERAGSATRRQLILSSLAALRHERGGGTGLYDTILAAYRHLIRTYRTDMVNTLLVFTDGGNDDPGGPSLDRTLRLLRAARDPVRPVQVVAIGVGPGVDTAALRRVTGVTGGGVYAARHAADIRQIFRTVTARRVCAPGC
ncbi:substrate-binding and VWA domain-containing protein [Actinomadura kijaniata]|uniref:substrate-binding domain-containing protein n=1 Tax=Actinomadura kijaniata TaxID=46161 RepID=UPI002FEB3E54